MLRLIIRTRFSESEREVSKCEEDKDKKKDREIYPVKWCHGESKKKGIGCLYREVADELVSHSDK